jgi:protein-S-isoprenylcysteine O-methyltransferase Ste14
MDTLRYILALFVVIGLPPGITWWYMVHPFVGFWRRMGATVTMTVMGVFMAASVVGLYLIREPLVGADLGLSLPRSIAGIGMGIAGFTIAIKRRKYLTNRILAGVPEVHADEDKRGELLNQGPYAIVRHPRYMEVALITVGYAAVANYVGSWIVALLTLPAIHLVVLLEEKELVGRFGDAYREYAEKVPRYIPKSWPAGLREP